MFVAYGARKDTSPKMHVSTNGREQGENCFRNKGKTHPQLSKNKTNFLGFSAPTIGQKNPRVRKIRVRNSGAGNGCTNFMDAWRKCVLSAGKPMSIKFRVLEGGFGGGGGKCRFYFYGREDFSE